VQKNQNFGIYCLHKIIIMMVSTYTLLTVKILNPRLYYPCRIFRREFIIQIESILSSSSTCCRQFHTNWRIDVFLGVIAS